MPGNLQKRTAAGIADSTAAGRALLTGADATAQRGSLSLVPASTRATIYVAKDGTDTRTGLSAYDPAKPFLTIKAALAAANVGDSIVVSPGAYSEGGGGTTGLQLKSNLTISAYGATITYAGTANPGLLNDGAGAVTGVKIYGGTWTGGASTCGLLTLNGSTILFEVDDLTGVNGGISCFGSGPNYITAYIPRCTGASFFSTSGYLKFFGDLIGVALECDAGAIYFVGNLSGGGVAVVANGGSIEGWGDVSAASDCLHAAGGNITWHGNSTSSGDTAVYCNNANSVVTLFGNATGGSGVINLCGHGTGVCASAGTVTVFGNVKGSLGVLCGDATVTINGNVSSTGATSYSEQNPQLDASFNFTEYRPSTASAQNDYLGAGAVKVAHSAGGTLTINGNVTTAFGHAVIVNAGSVEILGSVTSTDGCAIKQTGGTLKTHSRVDAGTLASLGTATAVAATDVVTVSVAHGRNIGDLVNFTNSGGGLPAGLTAGTDYFVLTVPSGTSMTLSTTAGGSTLDITTTGTGTHTIWPSGNPISKSGGTAMLHGGTSLVSATTPSRDSIGAGTAQNVKAYGTVVATTAKNVNVTLQVGTLTVDANVT